MAGGHSRRGERTVPPAGYSRGRRTFKFSTDPELEAKIRDVVGLYVHPPEKGLPQLNGDCPDFGCRECGAGSVLGTSVARTGPRDEE